MKLLAALLLLVPLASFAEVKDFTWAPPVETNEATPKPLTGINVLRNVTLVCDHTEADITAHEGTGGYLYRWDFNDMTITSFSFDFPVGSFVCASYARNDFGWSPRSNTLSFTVAPPPPPPPVGAPPKAPRLNFFERLARFVETFFHRLFT